MEYSQLIKGFNIFTGLWIIGIGCWIGKDYFLAVSPTFMGPVYIVIFGLLVILNEIDLEWIKNNMKFLNNNLGRGLYNLFLCSLVFSYWDEDNEDLKGIICLITSVILACLGFIYFFLSCTKGVESEVDNQALLSN